MAVMGLKRIAAVLFAGVIALAGLSAPVYAAGPEVSARAAVLFDAVSGTFLYEKNAREVLPMASTTKIMTALLAYESGRTDEPVEITEEMVAVEGSSMGLAAGDVLPLGELAEGMLMTSGNDAANAVALFLGGDAERFAEMMNARAAALGMENTHFVTPSGLDADGHGSTARDMALLGAAAMNVDGFAAAVGETAQDVTFLSPEKTLRFQNHNRLLSLYGDCTGIKTGFTKKAGRCLVSAAERNGARLICVTLNAPDDWNDHIALYEFGFSRFSEREVPDGGYGCRVPVVGGLLPDVACVPKSGVSAFLLEDAEAVCRAACPRFLYAPVRAGDTVGYIAVTVGETELVRVPLLAAETVFEKPDRRSALARVLSRVFGR